MPRLLQIFTQKVGRLVSADPIEAEFKPISVDQSVIASTQSHATRHRCSQRLSKGLFFTDKEKKDNILRMRKISLP